MLYLEHFILPGNEQQDDFFMGQQRTCYTDFYPFRVFESWEPQKFEFAPVTILYGGNGSGKTTLLNVIAEALKIKRGTLYNKSFFFPDYVNLCGYRLHRSSGRTVPQGSQIITSDDVFDYLLHLRSLNTGIDNRRENLLEEYQYKKHTNYQLKSLDDYEEFKQFVDAKRKSGSQFVKDRVIKNIREQSNGESAFLFFTREIGEDCLYLLDEPENSLSADMQQRLVQFLADSARFYGCQFIISTHSPFMLSMKNALIYDLDEQPAVVKKWTELGNVRVYYDFFREHREEFE